MPETIIDKSMLTDFDLFFYYGQNDLEIETKSDLLALLLQPKRSLFYSRSLDAAGVKSYENIPDGLNLRINLPYDIVNAVAKRNQFVSSGENGAKDRRVAVSQNTIRLQGDNQGNIDVSVLYIPLADFRQSQSLQVGLQGGS